MRAAILEGFGRPFVLDEVELQPPRTGEVTVRVTATGVCQSDVSTALGHLPHILPTILGHEGAGVVDEVGPGVTSVAPGDHVVVMFKAICGRCFYCLRAKPQLCERVQGLGFMDDGTSRISRAGQAIYHGMNTATFAERCVMRESALVKIPGDVPAPIAAVVGCAVTTGLGAAIHTGQVQAGESVVVLGCGGVGLNIIQGARLLGAEQIIAIDRAPSRLEVAKRLGATHLVRSTEEDSASVVRGLTEGRGADVVFESAGRSALQCLAVELVRPGGRAVLVGLASEKEEVSFPSFLFAVMEKRVLGCFYGSADPRRDVPQYLSLWRAGRLDLESLISKTAPLDQINRAMQDLKEGRGVRTVLLPSGA